jgi:hypothetical protein
MDYPRSGHEDPGSKHLQEHGPCTHTDCTIRMRSQHAVRKKACDKNCEERWRTPPLPHTTHSPAHIKVLLALWKGWQLHVSVARGLGSWSGPGYGDQWDSWPGTYGALPKGRRADDAGSYFVALFTVVGDAYPRSVQPRHEAGVAGAG